MRFNSFEINTKSIRFKIWVYLLFFTLLVVSLIWILQVLFIDSYYDEMQKDDIKDIAVQIQTAFTFYKAQADLVYETIEPEKLHAMEEDPEEVLLTKLASAMQELPADPALEAAYRKSVLAELREALPKKDDKRNKGALDKRTTSDDKLTETRRIATLRQHLLFLTEEHERM